MGHILAAISFRGLNSEEMPVECGFRAWGEAARRLRGVEGTLFLVGNGASSSMCSHFAADISKNAGIRTQIFTDAALLTAVGNDESFEEIYAVPLRGHGRPGDMLLAISSSGASPNIVAAIAVARKLGMSIVTLSAMSPANACRSLGDLNIYVPATTYGLAESAHAAILHYWADGLVAAAGKA